MSNGRVRKPDSEIDYSDIPPLGDDFFERARKRVIKPNKRPISIKLQPETIRTFELVAEKMGGGYQTWISACLDIVAEKMLEELKKA